MGSMCSKPDTHSGGHTVLGSSSSPGTSAGRGVAPAASPRNESAEEQRKRRAEAALQRIEKDKSRLVNKNNPNAGRLASQINKPVRNIPQARESEPLRWD